jgi:hypothetical protein
LGADWASSIYIADGQTYYAGRLWDSGIGDANQTPVGGKFMIRLARIDVAAPGKTFELMAALKEAASVVKSVAGVEVTTFASMGAQVGEFFSVSNYSNLADFEEKSAKILGSAKYQEVVKKLEGLIVPGASHDHFLREI